MEKTRQGRPVAKRLLVVRALPTSQSRAIVQFGPLRLQAAIGKTGRTSRKREGDGGTPIASMRLLGGFFRSERRRAVKSGLALKPIDRKMVWCDAPADPNYNRLVRGRLRSSHEDMKREDGLYDICLVMDWNMTKRVRHCGSAIFFHLIRPGYEPTAGCVAVHARDMIRILPFLNRHTVVRVL